jgi:hypothetical protein
VSTSQQTRTCAGCGDKADRDVLLRLVLAGDPPEVVPDVKRRAQGRGVSVHPRRGCLRAAVRQGGIARGLRTRVRPDADVLAGYAQAQYERRIAGLVASAVRAGVAEVGTTVVRRAIEAGQARLVLLSNDAAEAPRGVQSVRYLDNAGLGALVGRSTVSLIAVLDARLGREIADAVQSHLLLGEHSHE